MARHRAIRRRPGGGSRNTCRTTHIYGPGQSVGAGILRLVCRQCGAISIDLTRADLPTTTPSLFESRETTLEPT